MKRSLFAALILIGALSLTACNTMNGFGQDMRNAGSSISNASQR